MNLLICGDRNWTNKYLIQQKVQELLSSLEKYEETIIVIEGEANGADILGRQVAEELGLKVLKYPADWNRYGKAAGQIRNTQMLIEGKPNIVFAFHNNISQSKGTKDMITKANKAGIIVEIFTE